MQTPTFNVRLHVLDIFHKVMGVIGLIGRVVRLAVAITALAIEMLLHNNAERLPTTAAHDFLMAWGDSHWYSFFQKKKTIVSDLFPFLMWPPQTLLRTSHVPFGSGKTRDRLEDEDHATRLMRMRWQSLILGDVPIGRFPLIPRPGFRLSVITQMVSFSIVLILLLSLMIIVGSLDRVIASSVGLLPLGSWDLP